ncbi:MAG: site-specific DNA-methyltransferase [Anaerolineae bacterium]|nr:site-specific DNA-methyltransferase [Anaerolineae bacterium]
MARIDITRTELVWPGKYDDEGRLVPPRRVSLPFQVIERVNETRATRTQREADLQGHVGTLFDYWQAEEKGRADAGDGWRNKLIWGDNLYVMGSLLEHFAGKIDLIYIDPPFATGADFSFSVKIGESEREVSKEQSSIEEKAYRDTWGRGRSSYLSMMYERLVLIRDLLSERGTLYVHLDYRMASHLRLLLDDVFGEGCFQNEIIWHYRRWPTPAREFQKMHDNLLCYVKDPGSQIFNQLYTERTESTKQRWKDQRIVASHAEDGRRLPSDYGGEESPGAPMPDVWDMPIVAPVAHERTDYATQKPEALLEQIVQASSDGEGLVADFFCGSGTTLAAAEKLGRRWIGCDLSRYAIHITRKRLMDISDCRPFEILNMGQYERQVWQGMAFGGARQTQQLLIFEYLKFILDLYGAQPLPGTQHLHGKKGGAVVHVGAVDAPVTIDEVDACLAECLAMKQKELHVLGWEWEMGLANLMVDEARGRGVRLLLLTIPREVMEQQAVDRGDIRFYELAYLEVEIAPSRKKRSYTVSLTDFVIPNDELIPPEVRAKIKKWSDYVDYWAVDWDFRDDTFVNAWTSYRTRRERALQLKSEPHVYDDPGTYRVLVKVIDIFGNDTSQVYQVEVE